MRDIAARIEEIAAGVEGVISLAAKDLRTGETIACHDRRKCPTASVIKLPILAHVMLMEQEGALSLCETVTLHDADKVPGSGVLAHLSDGLTLTLRDACTLMIAWSDNTATNLVLERVGVEAVNARMQALGLRDTWLSRPVFRPSADPSPTERRYGLGHTTPRDMLRLLEAIHAGRIGGPDACALVRRMLAAQHFIDGIPRYLPAGASFEGKSGAVDTVRNDVGFVTLPDGRVLALAIFCSHLRTVLWTADNPGLLAIGNLARALVDHFGNS